MVDYLPEEIVEIILLKLPVAPLLRFKAVSKGWNAMISDPRFTRTHNSRSQNLFLAQHFTPSNDSPTWQKYFYFRRFKDGKYELGRRMGIPYDDRIICTDNGIVLLSTSIRSNMDRRSFMLWNPCLRQSTLIRVPYKVGSDTLPSISGLWSDPINDECKVVAAYNNFYSVYSCKNQSWSPKKKHPHWFRSGAGLTVDGAIYWYSGTRIIRFDPIDDSFKFVNKPQQVKHNRSLFLMALKGCLCLYYQGERASIARFWIKEKGVDSWKVLTTMEDLPRSLNQLERCVGLEENKILIRIPFERAWVPYREGIMVYNVTTESYDRLKRNRDEAFAMDMYPYRESLFFPTIPRDDYINFDDVDLRKLESYTSV